MQIDIVIPTRRPQAVLRALESLAAQTRRPDFVTLVTNEIEEPPEIDGMRVRVLNFRSDCYPIGDRDLALRRNVGIFFSRATHVITFDDDQVAPPNLVHLRALDGDLLRDEVVLRFDPAHVTVDVLGG